MESSKQRILDVLKQVLPDEDAEKIVFYLRGKINISEFIIAEELDLEIHKTRNLLYKLLDSNLVSFKRKKDKIKGWYICYWDFNESTISHLEDKLRAETIIKIRQRLENESGVFFYMCKYAHARQNFEIAFENEFKCPECGELMNQVDNARTIEFLKNRLEELLIIEEKAESLKFKPKIIKPKSDPTKHITAKEIYSVKKTTKKKVAVKKKTSIKKASSAKKSAVVKKEPTKTKASSAKKPVLKEKTSVKKKSITKKATVKKVSSVKKKSPVKKNSSSKKTSFVKKAMIRLKNI